MATTFDTDTGAVWKVVLVDQENAFVLTQDGTVQQYTHHFPADYYSFSPNAEFCIMYDVGTDECARLSLSTGQLDIVLPFNDPHTDYIYALVRVTDSGSAVVRHASNLRLYDPDLNLVVSNDDHFFGNCSVGYASDGHLMCITNGNQIDAYDINGNLLWTKPASLIPDDGISWGRIYVSPSGRTVLSVTNNCSEILYIHGNTGDTFFARQLDTVLQDDIAISPSDEFISYSLYEVNADNNIVNCATVTEVGLGVESIEFQNSFEYQYDGSVSLINPIQISDSGASIYMYHDYIRHPGCIKYVVFTSTGDCILCTEWINTDMKAFSFHSMLSYDASGICYYNGEYISIHSIECQ